MKFLVVVHTKKLVRRETITHIFTYFVSTQTSHGERVQVLWPMDCSVHELYDLNVICAITVLCNHDDGNL